MRPSLNALVLAALMGAAGLGLSPAFGLAANDQAAPALFAPPKAGGSSVNNKKTDKPANQTGQKPESTPEAPAKSPAEPVGSNFIPNPPPKAEPALPAAAAEGPAPGGFAPSPEVRRDSKGNKLLVIHGDQAPQVILDEPGGGQLQVLIGDDTAGLVMDSQGRKTLVVRGEPERPPAAAGGPITAPAAPSSSAPSSIAGEAPYWLLETEENSRPYWHVEERRESRPYWEAETPENTDPYWRVAELAEPARPYWLPEPEKIIISSDVQLAALPPPASPRPLAAPVGSDNGSTITYYMYQDERGVKHLTNIPDDPRYRLFTAVITVQRGLSAAGPRIRFTHETLRPTIMEAARIHNLDPALIAAVIKSESAFDSRAVSWAGAQGLMQLMPNTAREMGVANPFDPRENVMGGSRYLRKMLDQFGGDLTLAIAAYNCGPTRVAKVWRVPDIAETQNYVVIVMRNYKNYKQIF